MKNYFTSIAWMVGMLGMLISSGAYGQVNVEWDKTYGGDRIDEMEDMIATPDGGYLLGGSSDSYASFEKSEDVYNHFFYSDYWIVKTDASGNLEWDKTLGGTDYDNFASLVNTADGGYLIGGSSVSPASEDKTEDPRAAAGESSYDYWIVKLDAEGNVLWDKTIGGHENENLHVIIPTSDGGFLLYGYSYSGVSGDKTEELRGESDLWLVKIDDEGNILWDKSYGTEAPELARTIIPTDEGGYLLGGMRKHSPCDSTMYQAHFYDYLIVKIDEAGNQQWEKSYGGCESEALEDIVATADGGYLLGGYSSSDVSGDKTDTTRGYEDYWVVKIDASGNKLWDKAYGGSGFDQLEVMEPLDNGDFLLGGRSYSPVSGNKTASPIGYPRSDFWLIRIDAEGNKLWDETIGGTHYDELESILPVNGGFMLGGSSSSDASGDKSEDSRGNNNSDDYWLVKIQLEEETPQPPIPDPDKLAIEWDATFGGEEPDYLSSAVIASDGGYLLGGYSPSPVSGDKTAESRGIGRDDFWIVKTDENGQKLWDKAYGGSHLDYLQDIAALPDGGYLLAGNSASGISGDRTEELVGEFDYWVVRIDAEGNKLWDKAYGSNGFDQLNAVIPYEDGGFLLAGRSGGAYGDKSEGSRGLDDYWIVKIDAEGNKLWDRTYGGNDSDYLEAATTTPDGGYLLGGISYSNASGDKTEDSRAGTYYINAYGDTIINQTPDYWLVKVDAEGNKQWDKTFGGADSDFLRSVIATEDGGYLIGGYSESGLSGDKTEDSRGERDFWIVKINSRGMKEWDKTIGGADADLLFDVETRPEGGYLLGGVSLSDASGDKTEDSKGESDYWLVWIDEEGNVQQDQTIGGSATDELMSILSLSDNEYLLAGYSNSNTSGDKSQSSRGEFDYWIVKTGEADDSGEAPDPRPEPTAGHITGGGLFISPAGAYALNPGATGKAAFSFSARQKEDEDVPKGNASLALPAARLIFQSQTLDWLSVDEDRAFIKGRGRLNREEGYHFLISVVDHGQPAHPSEDQFRMIIWDEEENIVYDSEREADLYGGASNAILAGDITIHGQKGKTNSIFAREQENAQHAEIRDFRAYPTQLSQQDIWLELPATKEGGQLEVIIYDSQGRKMAVKSINAGAQGAKYRWRLDHQAWSPGIYFLVIEGQELNHQQKLVK